MQTCSGLRDRKRSETRTSLCRAALALALKAGGVAAVSVDAIAERAGVSRRTLFNYFPVKEAAFAWPMTSLALRFVEAAEGRPADEAVWEALREAATTAITDPGTDLGLAVDADRMLDAWPPLLAPRAGAVGEDDLTAPVAQRLLAEVTRRWGDDPAGEVHRQLVAGCAGVALRICVRRCAERGGDPATRVAEVFDALAAGVRQPSRA